MFPLLTQPPAAFTPELVYEGVGLRVPQLADYQAWHTLRSASKAHLTAWEDQWPEQALTLKSYRKRLNIWEKQSRNRTGLSLFIHDDIKNILVGGLTLTQIRYGASRAGILGYWIGEPHTRKGYARRAVMAAVGHAFDRIGLNRIEAACQPENVASAQLLSQCGFQLEGRAKDYLKINGVWRDHDIYAVVARNWPLNTRQG